MAMILWRSLRNIQAMGRHRVEATAGEAADTGECILSLRDGAARAAGLSFDWVHIKNR